MDFPIKKLWFSIAMLVHQRVYLVLSCIWLRFMSHPVGGRLKDSCLFTDRTLRHTNDCQPKFQLLLMIIQCYLVNFMWILDDFGFWFSLETWASFARRVWGIPGMSRQSGPPPSPRGAAPGAARVNVSARWLVWSSISDQTCHLWS